jgi:hypothetical protein
MKQLFSLRSSDSSKWIAHREPYLPVLTDMGIKIMISALHALDPSDDAYLLQDLHLSHWCSYYLFPDDIFRLGLTSMSTIHMEILSANRGISWAFVLQYKHLAWNLAILANNPSFLYTIPKDLIQETSPFPIGMEPFYIIVKRLRHAPLPSRFKDIFGDSPNGPLPDANFVLKEQGVLSRVRQMEQEKPICIHDTLEWILYSSLIDIVIQYWDILSICVS